MNSEDRWGPIWHTSDTALARADGSWITEGTEARQAEGKTAPQCMREHRRLTQNQHADSRRLGVSLNWSGCTSHLSKYRQAKKILSLKNEPGVPNCNANIETTCHVKAPSSQAGDTLQGFSLFWPWFLRCETNFRVGSLFCQRHYLGANYLLPTRMWTGEWISDMQKTCFFQVRLSHSWSRAMSTFPKNSGFFSHCPCAGWPTGCLKMGTWHRWLIGW